MWVRFLYSVVGLFALSTSPVDAKPLVLSSLRPLTLIAQEITGKAADVDTLLPSTASHHDYPMKTSDHLRLREADVFLWIGPELESFLQKPVANLPREKVLTAYELPGINWPAETRMQADHHHSHDPHLWLDPRNAVVVAKALATMLGQIDPANATVYQANLELFSQKAHALDKSLQLSLKPVTHIGFAVYHEGFSHFVGRYGLRQLDYVALTPEQKPGAKHMHQLREVLKEKGKCLFLEPYNDMKPATNLAQELHLDLGMLDALGARGATSYTQLIEQMAEAFLACLANGRN